jgi:hypothetical protein
MRRLVAALCVLALVGLSSPALAGVVHVYPNQVPDESIPRVNWGDAPAGWGPDSWQGPATGKSNLHVAPFLVFGTNITLGDLQSLSFWTKKGSTIPSNRDWWITIYTARENDGLDSGTWYDSRLHARPGIGIADQWNQWSTDAGTQQLKFYDPTRGGSGYFATLAQLTAGPVTLGRSTHDYSDEVIASITLQTDSGWGGFDGFVDGLTITLSDGRVGQVDLAAVPEPSAIGLLVVGAGMVAGLRIRGRRRSQ